MTTPSNPGATPVPASDIFQPKPSANPSENETIAIEFQQALQDKFHSQPNSPSLSGDSDVTDGPNPDGFSANLSPPMVDKRNRRKDKRRKMGGDGGSSGMDDDGGGGDGGGDDGRQDEEDESAYALYKKAAFKLKQKALARCNLFKQSMVKVVQSDAEKLLVIGNYGTNMMPAIEVKECIVLCFANEGPCYISLGKCRDNSTIIVKDITPANELFCGIVVMLHEGALNDENQMLSLEGHVNKSHLSPFVTLPGASYTLNQKGSCVTFVMVNDAYKVVNDHENTFFDEKVETELNSHGLSYHTYYNPQAITA